MIRSSWQQFRIRLAYPEAALPLAVLGLLAGGFSAAVIIVFRESLQTIQSAYMPGADGENFEQLSSLWHLGLPLGGALVLGALMSLVPAHWRGTGVVHVISCLHREPSRLPWQNAIVQFFGALIGLATGQSGGREGPAVHLGATGSSALGQWAGFPHNSLRVLAACGAAGAIAASFNTPIAAVIFAMEVIMMEYTVAGFLPVLLSAVTATAINQLWFDDSLIADTTGLYLTSLGELPLVALLGLLIGSCSAVFVSIQSQCLKFQDKPLILRFGAAGLITGACALWLPAVLGTGHDTLTQIMSHSPGWLFLLALLAAKLLATAVTCGVGMPIGVIGPAFLLGAMAGSAFAQIHAELIPGTGIDPQLYALLGMGAMMGALLNAPLAALLALLELSGNTAIVFPAMLAVVVAQLTHRELFKQKSSPATSIDRLDKPLRTDPVSRLLMSTSVLSCMSRDVVSSTVDIDTDQLQNLIESPKRWLVVEEDDGTLFAIEKSEQQDTLESLAGEADALGRVSLRSLIDGQDAPMRLSLQSSLLSALDAMQQSNQSRVIIAGFMGQGPFPDIGIITLADIEARYRGGRQDATQATN